MNLKSVLFGIISFTTVIVSTPDVYARNPARYTNIPFIVTASCPNFDSSASSKYVSTTNGLVIQAVVAGIENAGFEYYCSSPGTGTLPNTSTGSFPTGTMTFNISGLPSTGYIETGVYYTNGPAVYAGPSFSTGTVSVPANVSGVGNVKAIQIYLGGTSAPTTVTMSNFRYNNVAALADTTVTDQSDSSANYCYERP